MRFRLRIFALFSIFSLFTPGCRRGTPVSPSRPKLLVWIVADQLRPDALTRYAPLLTHPSGFATLRTGARGVGHYGQQNTYTGSGHALLSTGAYGYANGITQNRWFNRTTHQTEAMLFDPDATLIGETPNASRRTEEETSPKNLVGTTLADELRMAFPASKAMAIAGKGRSAVLLAGRMGEAYWFGDSGRLTTSTFYKSTLPAWVDGWNAERRHERWFQQTWSYSRPPAQYQGPDDAPGEGEAYGLGHVFPHPLRGTFGKSDESFVDAVMTSSHGIRLLFDAARTALVQEHLGEHAGTDMLAISVSSLDLVGHTFGPGSHEYQDALAVLDDEMGSLLEQIRARFPRPDDVLVAFAADHGATPTPEQLHALRIDAGRIPRKVLQDAIEKKLSAEVGPGPWVLAIEEPGVYLDPETAKKHKVSLETVEQLAGQAALSVPGMEGFLTRSQILQGHVPPTKQAQAVVRSYYPPRGGNVILWAAPFYFFGRYAERPSGSSHGSLYRYDSDVPVFLHGPWFQSIDGGVIDVVDLPATLAHVLKISPPAACEGRPLPTWLRYSGDRKI